MELLSSVEVILNVVSREPVEQLSAWRGMSCHESFSPEAHFGLQTSVQLL